MLNTTATVLAYQKSKENAQPGLAYCRTRVKDLRAMHFGTPPMKYLKELGVLRLADAAVVVYSRTNISPR